ncbi:hypothetical protein [Streptomyces sp. R35]|uniref:Uncharacterized protein n=1 Tax=Streptomyces sp. R35 TaxID=3238630 RepID=A0AB39SPI4_9ACTN
MPVVVGPDKREREVGVSSVANILAEKPGKDGKFIWASTPPAFMSLMRSWTS